MKTEYCNVPIYLRPFLGLVFMIPMLFMAMFIVVYALLMPVIFIFNPRIKLTYK